MSSSSPTSAIRSSLSEEASRARRRPSDPSDCLEVLARLGVAQEFAAQIASSLGDRLFDIIAAEPYELCELLGLSFPEVDSFAMRQGFSLDDPGRLRRGVLHLLANEEAGGNCFSVRTAFFKRAERFLQASSYSIGLAISELAAQGRVIPQGERLWSRGLAELEAEVAQRVLSLCSPVEVEGEEPEAAERGEP